MFGKVLCRQTAETDHRNYCRTGHPTADGLFFYWHNFRAAGEILNFLQKQVSNLQTTL